MSQDDRLSGVFANASSTELFEAEREGSTSPHAHSEAESFGSALPLNTILPTPNSPVDRNHGRLDEDPTNSLTCTLTYAEYRKACRFISPSIATIHPGRSAIVSFPPDPRFCGVYLDALECGLRFPLHLFLIDLFHYFECIPCSFTPHSYLLISTFLIRCAERGVTPTLDLFFYLFKIGKSSAAGTDSYLSISQHGKERRLFGAPVTSFKGWKSRFLYVYAGSPPPFDNHWKKTFRRSRPASQLVGQERKFARLKVQEGERITLVKGFIHARLYFSEERLGRLGLYMFDQEQITLPEIWPSDEDVAEAEEPAEQWSLAKVTQPDVECRSLVVAQACNEDEEEDDMVDDRPLMLRLKQKSLAQTGPASPAAEKPQQKRKKLSTKDDAEASKKPKEKADHSSPLPTAEGGAKNPPKRSSIDLSKEDDGATPTVNASQRPPAKHILTKNTGGSRQAVINLPKEGGMLCGSNSLLDAYPWFITRGDKAQLDGLTLEGLEEKCGRSITDAAIYAFGAFAKYRKELSAALESEAKALTKEIDVGKALEDQKKINNALVTENGDLLGKLKKADTELVAERDAAYLKGKADSVEEFKKSDGFLLEACKYIKEHPVAFENSKFGTTYSSEVGAMSYAYGMYTMQHDIYNKLKDRDPSFKPAALGLPKKRIEPTVEHYATDYEDSSDEEVTATETSAPEEQTADLQADAKTQVNAEQAHAEEAAQEGTQGTNDEAAQEKTEEAAREDGAQQNDEDAQVFGQLADLV